ncbi:MAG: hypothetical protein LIP12_00745 [Clostridiales bacterium]|nr:hypothetical protein [Clostridiales bacterium]
MGKTISLQVYISEEDAKRFDKILHYLNSSNEVTSGDVPAWDETSLYGVLLSNGIEQFKFNRSAG